VSGWPGGGAPLQAAARQGWTASPQDGLPRMHAVHRSKLWLFILQTYNRAPCPPAVEISKGIRGADGSLKAAPAAAGGDPAMQALLCLYCFLAGIAVSTGRLLWLLPLATAASAAVHWLAGAASQLALPFYRELPPERAALWRVDLTHLAYSAVTGGWGAGWYGCVCEGAVSNGDGLFRRCQWLAWRGGAGRQSRQGVDSTLLCWSECAPMHLSTSSVLCLSKLNTSCAVPPLPPLPPLPAALLVGVFLLACPRALLLSAQLPAAGMWCADLPQALIVASGGLGPQLPACLLHPLPWTMAGPPCLWRQAVRASILSPCLG
jgi:hypothetical protein